MAQRPHFMLPSTGNTHRTAPSHPNDHLIADRIIGDMKKEGRYDALRRNIADELTVEGILPVLQAGVEKKVERMLNNVHPSTKKHELRAKVKEVTTGTKVDSIARERVLDMKVYEQLRAEIAKRVRIQLGLDVKTEESDEQ